jgi:hypothetical protein
MVKPKNWNYGERRVVGSCVPQYELTDNLVTSKYFCDMSCCSTLLHLNIFCVSL